MDGETQHGTPDGSPDGVIVRRSARGWRVGNEEAGDLTSAMVLADLLAADLGAPAPAPALGPPAGPDPAAPAAAPASQEQAASQEQEAARLAVTVAQLTRALAARVRVEQAIGVLAERHRLPPREAFDLLRNVARARGDKVLDIAETVVDSASNPLLPLPDELARRQLPPRMRGRSPRHVPRGARGEGQGVRGDGQGVRRDGQGVRGDSVPP